MQSESNSVHDFSYLKYHYGQNIYQLKQSSMEADNTCRYCFMCGPMCICKAIRLKFDQNAETFGRIKASIAVFMHFKEWGRASNTGKLVAIGDPEKSLLGIYGVEDSEKPMIDFIQSHPTIVLFPSPAAEPISKYRNWYSNNPNACLLVLDATWSQAGAMERSIPSHIPRVRLDAEITSPSQYLNRKQSSNTTKISTIEAIAIALEALGEPREALTPLYSSLHLSVDSVRIQGGLPPAYGNQIIPQLSSNPKHNGPFTKSTANRPSHCPHCAATYPETRFKNLGTHRRMPFRADSEIKTRKETEIRVETETETETETSEMKDTTDQPSSSAYRVWQCKSCSRVFEMSI